MAGRNTTTIEVSLETYDRLMELGAFPETLDELVGRLINGAAPKPRRDVVRIKLADGKKRQIRKKIGCEWCDRVFLGGQGYASHLRTHHPKHYHPAHPTPLSQRKTVLYRTEADRLKAEAEVVPVEVPATA
jgi:hypothetical protein